MHLRYGISMLLLLCGVGARATEAGALLTLQAPEVVFTQQAGVYLRQEGTAQLAKGENRLLFDFRQLDVDPASVDLRLMGAPAGVQVVGQQLPGKDTGQMLWLVQAQQPTTARLRLAYAVKGLEGEVVYVATLKPAQQQLALEAQVALKNASKESLRQVQVVLASGHKLNTSLEQGQTIQQRLFRFDDIPYEVSYLYDNSRFKDSVRMILTLRRDGDNAFDRLSLPAGRIKVYSSAAGATPSFVAEGTIPYIPRRELVELDLGTAPELTVVRTKLRGEQVNVRSDVYRKLAIFDLEEEYEFEIENHRAGRVALVVQEHVPGEWQMLKNSADYEKKDAGTLEFRLPLPPGQTTKFGYTVKRLNVEP